MSADVAVIGLGRVGLPLALAFADAGLDVIGVDNAAEHLAAIRAGRMPFDEPGAQAVLDRVGGRLELSERAPTPPTMHGNVEISSKNLADAIRSGTWATKTSSPITKPRCLAR